MKAFKVLGTNHTSFTVSDLGRTTAFFRDCLGFEVTNQAPRSKELIETMTGIDGAGVIIGYVRGPGHSIELIEYTGPDDRGHATGRPCDNGFSHVAYDVDDIDAAIEAAAEYGFEPLGGIATVDKGPNTGGRAAYLRDGDGVNIEFIQPPPA